MLHPRLQQTTEPLHDPTGYPEPLIMQWAKTTIIMALQFRLLMAVKANAHHFSAILLRCKSFSVYPVVPCFGFRESLKVDPVSLRPHHAYA